MLMVTRIAKTASGIGFGGGKQNTQVLRWEKDTKKVLLRVVSHQVVAADSLPIHEAVVNSNFEPILYRFDIKTIGKDSTSTCYHFLVTYFILKVTLQIVGETTLFFAKGGVVITAIGSFGLVSIFDEV